MVTGFAEMIEIRDLFSSLRCVVTGAEAGGSSGSATSVISLSVHSSPSGSSRRRRAREL